MNSILPSGSRSSTSSSSVRPARWKKRHQNALSSRRCQSRSWPRSHRACWSSVRSMRSAGAPSVSAATTAAVRSSFSLEVLRRLCLGLQRRSRDRAGELRLEIQPARLEQIPQPPVAQDVVAVVAGDRAQDVLADLAVLRRAALEPRLERDDARARTPELDLAHEAVQRLQPLDGVALDARPDALPDDPEQVDEHAAAEQPIDFLLARRMPLREPGEGGLLVGGVVVDVHRRVGIEPGDEQVDELFERRLLGVARHAAVGRAAPDLVEARLAGSIRVREIAAPARRTGIRRRPRARTGRPRCRRTGRARSAPAGP